MILALGALLAVTADILVVPGLYVNPGVEPLQLGIVALLVLVMALNGTVALHNIDGRTVAGSAGGLFGTAGALFTSACPFCQPIWLVWLGFGSATAFLAQYGALIGIGSIALLGISLHYGLKSASGTCEVKLSVLKPSRVSDRSKSGGFFHGKNA
jgi:hypothetical protein